MEFQNYKKSEEKSYISIKIQPIKIRLTTRAINSLMKFSQGAPSSKIDAISSIITEN
jgi:hypothetical protein